MPGTWAGLWALARCPTGSTGVAGEDSCGVFLPEPSSPDASSSGVAAPLSLETHPSSSSLPTVEVAIVKPALGLPPPPPPPPPPRGGGGFVARRVGGAPETCSRGCTWTVLPVRETFTRGFGCRIPRSTTSPRKNDPNEKNGTREGGGVGWG